MLLPAFCVLVQPNWLRFHPLMLVHFHVLPWFVLVAWSVLPVFGSMLVQLSKLSAHWSR